MLCIPHLASRLRRDKSRIPQSGIMTFFFTIIFMFLVFWRPQEWLVPWLYGWPILDLVVVLALMSLLIETDQGKIYFPKKAPQIYMLGGLWLAAIASQAVHTYFAGMQMAMIEVFKICFFTLLLYCVLDSPKRLRTMAWIFVLTACVMAVHALLQDSRGYGFKFQRPMWIPSMAGNPPYMRSIFFGIFSDPNDLAQVFATAIPLCFVLTKRMNFLWFLLSFAIAAFLFKAYLTTHSRGGMVAIVTAGFVMAAMFMPSRWMPYIVGVGAVAALVLCRLKGASLLDMSARERVVFWGYGNMAFKKNPIFGVGYGMYWQIADGRPAHNAFVTCYTELGIFGYWMWFSFLMLGVLGSWRVRVATRWKKTVEQAYLYRFSGLGLAALGGFCASAYFLSRTFVYPMFFLMAMANAVPRIAEWELGEDSPVFIQPKRDVGKFATIATFGSIVYIYISIIFLNQAYGG